MSQNQERLREYSTLLMEEIERCDVDCNSVFRSTADIEKIKTLLTRFDVHITKQALKILHGKWCNDTPLFKACAKGRLDIIKLLANYEVDVRGAASDLIDIALDPVSVFNRDIVEYLWNLNASTVEYAWGVYVDKVTLDVICKMLVDLMRENKIDKLNFVYKCTLMATARS